MCPGCGTRSSNSVEWHHGTGPRPVIRLFVNGLGASAGAGITYLLNVLPHLSANLSVHTILAVQPQLRAEFDRIPNLTLSEAHPPQSTAMRFWFEQYRLPQLVRDSGADVLISAVHF